MALPRLNEGAVWLSWVGLETDLIFNKGIDLPGFASFPLLESETGRALLRRAYEEQIAVASRTGTGVCLESVTWKANADRAAPLGYRRDRLVQINRDAIAFIDEIDCAVPRCLSAQIGPRGDGYEAGEMTAEVARSYHAAQIEALVDTAVDLLSAFTVGSADEATGMVLAARDFGMPITVAFTVETDGRLPDGRPLAEAIDAVDQATGGATAYFLVNCAHPDHLAEALNGDPVLKRLAGVIANASRQSHAELDESETLDDGNPGELARQLAAIRAAHPWMSVFGGCCGTDMRHLEAIGRACTA